MYRCLPCAALIATWQTQARFSHDVDWVGPMIIKDAARVLALRARIAQLEVSCESLVKDSTDAQVTDSLPGFGLVCASELAGEIGTLKRFANEGSLAVYLWIMGSENLIPTPITESELLIGRPRFIKFCL